MTNRDIHFTRVYVSAKLEPIMYTVAEKNHCQCVFVNYECGGRHYEVNAENYKDLAIFQEEFRPYQIKDFNGEL